MKVRLAVLPLLVCLFGAVLPVVAPLATAQTHGGSKSTPKTADDKDAGATQEQALQLLHLSPTLAAVVAIDPSLLSDRAYVARNNPELAQFLSRHPEVARNPDFYLFSHLQGGHRGGLVLRRVIPQGVVQQSDGSAGQNDMLRREQMYQQAEQDRRRMDYEQRQRLFGYDQARQIADRVLPTVLGLAALGVFIWLIRVIVEGLRWSRTFKQQSEMHGRLIEELSKNQQLSAYLDSEAGRQFLMAAPVAAESERNGRSSSTMTRVLIPLQLGIVLTLLGVGLLALPRQGGAMSTLVLGVLALMPGIGFILSAAATWILARRLGMMPERVEAKNEAGPFGSHEL